MQHRRQGRLKSMCSSNIAVDDAKSWRRDRSLRATPVIVLAFAAAFSLTGCLFWATAAEEKPDAGGKPFKDAGTALDAGSLDAGPLDVDAGILDGGAMLDAGSFIDAGGTDAGSTDAGHAICGNGVTEAPAEACDDENDVDDDYCSNDCRRVGFCGDGIRQSAVEQCDEGDGPGEVDCTNECQIWWDAEFTSRLAVTIDNPTNEAMLNVPVAVKVTLEHQVSLALNKGKVCALADDHQLLLASDIEIAPTLGAAVVWAQIPILPPGPLTFFLYGSNDDGGPDCPRSFGQVFSPVYSGVWHMETTSPLDATGNGNDASPFGSPVSFNNGVLGAAVQTGVNSHVRVDDVGEQLGFLGDMTVEGWVRMDAFQPGGVNADRSTIFQVSQHLIQEVEPFIMNFMHDGHLRAHWRPEPQIDAIETETPTAFAFGQWRHLAWVRDATALTVRFYVDGIQHGSAISYDSNPLAQTPDGRFRMGGGHASVWSLAGAIDEVRITDRVLSSSWIDFQVKNQRGENIAIGMPEVFNP